MNEDLKPCLDIESEWEISSEYGTRPGIQVFQHKMHKDLLRVIDYRNQAFFFTDKHRVKLSGVIDINKKIEPIRKANLATFLNSVMAAEKPISMPYTPEKIKVYIEDLGDILGVLYYMDSDPEKTLVPIKRYFKMEKFQKPEEISFDEYQTFKEKMESEDKE